MFFIRDICCTMTQVLFSHYRNKRNMCLSNKYSCQVFFLTLLLSVHLSNCTLCYNTNSESGIVVESGPPSTANYTCPGPGDPKQHTNCCPAMEGMHGCCPRARYFYEIDRTLAATIAITVTTLGIVLTVVVVVCCFWSRCPLYDSCRIEPLTADIATTYVSNKAENLDLEVMPKEVSGRNNKFSPVSTSNGNLPLTMELGAC